MTMKVGNKHYESKLGTKEENSMYDSASITILQTYKSKKGGRGGGGEKEERLKEGRREK